MNFFFQFTEFFHSIWWNTQSDVFEQLQDQTDLALVQAKAVLSSAEGKKKIDCKNWCDISTTLPLVLQYLPQFTEITSLKVVGRSSFLWSAFIASISFSFYKLRL